MRVLLALMLGAWAGLVVQADQTVTVTVNGTSKTLNAISTSHTSKTYWGAEVSSDSNGVVSKVETTYTNSKKISTSTTITLSGKTGTAKVIVFCNSSSSPSSGTTKNTITIEATEPPPPEEVSVGINETNSFNFTWTADSNSQYWQVIANSGSQYATATVNNPGDYNTNPKGSKTTKNTITITGVAAGEAMFTVQNKSTSNNPWDDFKTYKVTVTNPYTPLDAVPQAVTGLEFDNTAKTGVAAGAHYTRGGTYSATDAGTYTATVTPDDGYCWPNMSRATKEISWTIAKRPVTVTVIPTNKVVGATFDGEYNDPIFTTTAEGFVAGDTVKLTWDIFRTNACEDVGTYDLLIEGNEQPKNYAMTYVGGTYEIKEAPPTFDLTIAKGDGVRDVQTNGVSVVGTLALPADTTEVELELVADGLTIPVYKVITNNVTNVTMRVAAYPVAAGCTLAFIAEEAKTDDPAVTPTQVTEAIVAAIDKGESHDAAVAKVETITEGDTPAVEPKDLAKWITDSKVSSAQLAGSDYVVASVNLGAEGVIANEAACAVTEIAEITSEAFTFTFAIGEMQLDLEGKEAYVAGCIETTGDLGAGFGTTVDAKRVTIGQDGSVKITPDPNKASEFFQIRIPKDPGKK